ncbi:MAG: Deoxyribodipyrimidine photo-lyase [Paracidovorax wautersii]|uniref:Deoxyribodipyrimidine photo-lyase n=1 Tax=Paracidovorax wautersii TaxID=1177982 RepID=A0A7V8FRM9_9BURK|nr:MAG: Deoxyribodipyrimidine photo-lyase [Paracidovorax wautersii]
MPLRDGGPTIGGLESPIHPPMPHATYASGLLWLRRDLRIADNHALHRALLQCGKVHVAFVFDTDILEPLPRQDRRVEFIVRSLAELDAALRQRAGSDATGLITLQGPAASEIPLLAQSLGVQVVWAAHDDEPAALRRDARVLGALADLGIAFHTVKDHLVFERQEIQTQAGTACTVFTPYKRRWLQRIADEPGVLAAHPSATADFSKLAPRPPRWRHAPLDLPDLGFQPSNLRDLAIPTGESGGRALFEDFRDRLDHYHATRDFPAVKGPSYLGVHLRFGTVSVRELARQAWQRQQQGSEGAAVWLSELAWRDFFHQILANFPHVEDHAFHPAYDHIRWEHGKHADALFAAWCEGRTGYPLVDAAMAQINATGYMHNRLRMLTASFLVKDLGIAWRRGEAYFAEKLNDFDLAANNGNWQWAASSGCDAQPWFRVFNPVRQSVKFDPQGKFIRRYLPQLARLSDKLIHTPWLASPIEREAAGVGDDVYPPPIVDHEQARARTLERYRVVRKDSD